MKKSILFGALGVFMIGCFSTVYAEQYVMKLGLIIPIMKGLHFASTPDEDFAKRVERMSKGRIKVELHPASALGGPRSLLVQSKKGIVQGCDAEGAYLSYFLPQAQVISLPYIFRSEEVAWRVLDLDGPFMKDFNKNFTKKTGLRIIALGENSGGFRHFSNNKRVIKNPADMKGLKIRTMRLPIHLEMVKYLGASPTPIGWAELYTALQTGVVDGEEQGISGFRFGRHEEVQKYVTLDGHVYAIYCLMLNNAWFEKLPKDLQEVVTHCGRVFSVLSRGISQYNLYKDLEYLQSKGMEFYTPTEEEKNQFKSLVCDKVLDYARKQIGAEWVDKILKAIAEAEKELGY